MSYIVRKQAIMNCSMRWRKVSKLFPDYDYYYKRLPDPRFSIVIAIRGAAGNFVDTDQMFILGDFEYFIEQ